MGRRNFKEQFGQALFFLSPTPQCVPHESKVEPGCRLLRGSPILQVQLLERVLKCATVLINRKHCEMESMVFCPCLRRLETQATV